MLSGAGGALARRRPEISWLSLLLGPLVFGSLLFSFFSVNLPKNPNLSSSVFFFSDRHLWNGEREQCFIICLNQTSSINLSLNRATEFLHQSNDDAAGQIWGLHRSGKQTKPDPAFPDDAVAQIWGLYRSGKQTKSYPALRPSSRCKSTKNHSKQCDRPLPPPSTLTPAFPSPARRSMPSTMTPANPPCLTLPSTRIPASTPMYEQPPLGPTMGTTTGETLILQMGCFLGMGLAAPGPKRFRHRPICEVIGQTQGSSWPRSVYFNLLTNPKLSLSSNVAESGRRVHFHIGLTLLVRLVKYQLITLEEETFNIAHRFDLESACIKPGILKIQDPFSTPPCLYWNVTIKEANSGEKDWKKAQVDSKKILAQPHQSPITPRVIIESDAKAVTTAIDSRKTPANLTEIVTDISHIAKSFWSVSFNFTPRSQNCYADDLAKKALRSMITGLDVVMLCNSLFLF